MRYVIAAIVATLLIGALFVNHWRVASFQAAADRQLAQALGTPPGARAVDYGFAVGGSMSLSIKIDHLFRRLGFAIIPGIVVICFGTARLAGRPS